MAQKARREVEEKAWEEAERQRAMEEEERKRRTMEYLQQLRDEVLEEKATLSEGAEGSQVAGSKHKEVAARDKEVQRPSKKARGKQPRKYCGGAIVKMGILMLRSMPPQLCMDMGKGYDDDDRLC